jgi:hypothetical protein
MNALPDLFPGFDEHRILTEGKGGATIASGRGRRLGHGGVGRP